MPSLVPRAASPHGDNLVAAVNDIWAHPLGTCDVLELCVILIIRGSFAIRRGLCRWLAFAAFSCWLEWNFGTRYCFFAPTRKQNAFLVRGRCRCYEKDTGLRRLLRTLLYLLAVAFWNQWAYRQCCTNSCNVLNYKLLYGFKPVSQYAHSHKKQGDEHIYILL